MPQPNMKQMIGEVAAMQAEMAAAQEALAKETVTADAGDGAVVVTLSGDFKVQTVQVSPEMLARGDTKLFEDLITTAVNTAIVEVQKLATKRLSSVSDSLDEITGH